jgi:hypothetical protein
MDGAHTHGHGHGPTGLAELVVLGAGIVLAADILARVLILLLIVLAVAGGLLLIGFIGYVVAACRRYQQATAEQHQWPVMPDDLPRVVNADPVTLRQAIAELHAQLLIARGGLPTADTSQHQHLHFHGLTPDQAAAIIAQLQVRQRTAGWQDGGSP